MADLATRVRVMEEQVEILRRALGLAAVGAKPAVEWADAQMKRAREGEFRYSLEPTEDPNLSEIPNSSTEVKDHSDADSILNAADWLESIRYEQWNGSARRPNNYHRAAEDLRRHARQMAEQEQQ